ncbi:MAG: hypothetical protein ABI743_03435 [bacterium]
MTHLAVLLPFLAQNAVTDALDSVASSVGQPDRMAIYTLTFTAVVILLVLGTEFWVNLYGILTAPTVAFSRLMGEQQLLPAIFLILLSGILLGIFMLLIMTTPEYMSVAGDKTASIIQTISDQFTPSASPTPAMSCASRWTS